MTELFLVDDEPDVTSSLHWLLQTVGRKATAFNSPQEFLQYFATFTGPCCVVLDLRMPGLTGIEVLERIVGTRHDTPVVFLTGHGDVPSAVRAMKLGAYDFLVSRSIRRGFWSVLTALADTRWKATNRSPGRKTTERSCPSFQLASMTFSIASSPA